jgi:hypothetical protein
MIDQMARGQYYHAFTDSSIAQSVEQRTVNPCVPGSSPGRGAKILKALQKCGAFLFSTNSVIVIMALVIISISRNTTTMTTTLKQHNNPLHGITLEAIVTTLVNHYGWDELAKRIPVRCFSNDPSISSSLKFLRKTPWARDKVELLYLTMLANTSRTDVNDPYLNNKTD